MATVLGTVYLNGCNYQLAYDLLGQYPASNQSNVRLYGILNVTNTYISWTRGSASVHTSSTGIGTYYAKGSYTLITADFTFTHDNNGNFSAYIGASLSTTFVSGDTGGTLTLPKINRYPVLNSGSNFTDETNPIYNITSYGTFPIRIKLEAGGNNQLITRDVSSSISNYTLQLTDEERQKLRMLSPNSNKLNVIETVCAMSGNNELSASYKAYTMTIVNANPTFIDFDFKDINSKTVSLTGNNQSIISGYSNIKATISTENMATAIKGASMSKYRLSVGENNSTDITYSSSEEVTGTVNAVSSSTINVYAIDSRNNSTLVSKQAVNFYTYNPLIKGNISLERSNNGVGENVTLTYNGTIDTKNFGAVTNSIKTATYTLQRSDSSTIITGKTNIIPTTKSDGSFSFTGLIKGDTSEQGFDIGSSYIITVTITDELSSITYSTNLGSGRPNIALAKNGVSIMGKYDEELGGSLQVAGLRIDNNYSEEEIPIGKWIDGKTIYRRVFDFGYLTTVGENSISTDLDMTNFNFTKLTGIAQSLNQSGNAYRQVFAIPSARNSNDTTLGIWINPYGELHIHTGSSDRSQYYAYVIVEYTKTTDTV